MTPTPLLRLMTKVARLYYEQGLRQAEIADRLDLSQSRVSRLLKQAEKEGRPDQAARFLGRYLEFEPQDLEQRARLGSLQHRMSHVVDDWFETGSRLVEKQTRKKE